MSLMPDIFAQAVDAEGIHVDVGFEPPKKSLTSLHNGMKLVDCVSTGTRLPEHVARDVDALYKTLPSGCEYRTKAYVPDAVQFEPGERAEVSIISTNSRDKSNEVVLVENVDLDAYRANPVVLWNHRRDQPPVATCQWIKHAGNAIRAKSIYPERIAKAEGDEERPWYIDEVWDMVRAGVLKAKSIGFLPRVPLRDPTREELAANPDWDSETGVWEDVVMLEYSCCAVGVNNDSLVEAVAKGLSVEALAELGLAVEFPRPTVKAEVKAEPEVKLSRLEALCKSDDCVSKKIKYMYDQGEDKTYSKEQIQAIAYAHCHAKSMRRRKKAVDWDRVLADEIDRIAFDVRKIVNMAGGLHKLRGRV